MSDFANSSPTIGLFKGAHNFLLNNPTIVANYTNQNETNAIQLLVNFSLPGAEFDSSERDPPPRCPPGAHLDIIQDLQSWAHNPLRETSLRWVSGLAGVGKTAIMQTFSELEAASEESILGATLFFSKANKRNDPQRVFITIAYQLAVKYPPYRKYVVKMILHDPKVIQKSMTEQFKRFILQPVVVEKLFEGLHETMLIILDGLDKCKGDRQQQEIASLIRQMTTQHPTSPLIWLIASRPEPHIKAVFTQVGAIPLPVSLKPDQTSEDVECDSHDKLQTNREANLPSISPSVVHHKPSVPPPVTLTTPPPFIDFPSASKAQEHRHPADTVVDIPSEHHRGCGSRVTSTKGLEKNEKEVGAELMRRRERLLHDSRRPRPLLDDDIDSDVSAESSDDKAPITNSQLNQGGSSTRSTLPTPRPPLMASDSTGTLVESALERRIQGDVESIQDKTVNTTERLADLRALMEGADVHYYLVPSGDAHGTEYVAASDKRLEFITGFTGAKGDAIITRDSAYLVTTPQYWARAKAETDKSWMIIQVGVGHDDSQDSGHKDWIEFLLTLLSKGQRIGLDARFISHENATVLHRELIGLDCKFSFPSHNLVDLVWKNKPGKPRNLVYIRAMKYTGRDASFKLHKLREWIKAQPPAIPLYVKNREPTPQQMNVGMLVNSLSCISWTLNLYGIDIPFNPVFHAYLFIGLDKTILFLDSSKVDEAVANYLEKMNVERRNYTDLWPFLRKREWGEGKLLIPQTTSYAISLMLTHLRYTLARNRVEDMMTLKNDTELEGLRKAYIRDGVAFVQFLAWLDNELNSRYDITEWEAAWRIKEFRMRQKKFMGLAYETISASGPNGAIPHYVPKKHSARMIDRDTPYLNDSGGQYRDGTCDTTRTVHFGRPTPDQSEAYTRVLQGHIAIDSMVFPEGTSGSQLDVLARKVWWKDGLNYVHGTGHGFGSVLSVHEGDHGFNSLVPLVPGHVITNETGFYIKGKWGVRIGSALIVRRVQTRHEFNGDVWLGFERLTCVPIQTRMVKESMLTKEEKSWLKEHNQKCWDALRPHLKDDKVALKWLKREVDRGIGIAPGPVGMAIDWD
ncbi:putative Xaa-Pro aminopeptidase P [Leucoagaricus sp. SymC.cos]|nr:putative Xaa-Pro aminopeptidase P [Leucoagaricus sp. SymC.cos]